MAVTASIYGLFFSSAFNKELDWNSDTIKCMLTTSAYVPNQDTHQYKVSVTNEVVGTAYVAGGATLGSPTITYTGGANICMLDANSAVWNASTITARSAVVYDATPGADATDPLATWTDFGADQTTNNGTFQVTWNASGIVQVTVS